MRPRLNLVLWLCLVMLGAGAAVVLAQSSLADFGLKENELRQGLVNSLAYGNIPVYPNTKLFKAASPGAQAAFVKNTLGWLKTYSESAAFKADYDKRRESAKAAPPKSKGTPDEQYAKYLAEQRQSLETMKQNVAKMSPDMQTKMAGMVKQMEASVERSSKDPQMAAMMKQGYAQAAISEQKDYQDQLAVWGKKYPADPRMLIATRLHQFLDLSQKVAFDAKLAPGSGGKMKFADPQYEAKSSQWKLCYRAGRQPVEAARAFAVEWLRQIEKK
jgi:hypothetical protein